MQKRQTNEIFDDLFLTTNVKKRMVLYTIVFCVFLFLRTVAILFCNQIV